MTDLTREKKRLSVKFTKLILYSSKKNISNRIIRLVSNLDFSSVNIIIFSTIVFVQSETR